MAASMALEWQWPWPWQWSEYGPKEGRHCTEVSILDTVEEIVSLGKTPDSRLSLEVVWHDEHLYVAGTYNRRLCVHRLPAIYFPEHVRLINVRIVNENSPKAVSYTHLTLPTKA